MSFTLSILVYQGPAGNDTKAGRHVALLCLPHGSRFGVAVHATSLTDGRHLYTIETYSDYNYTLSLSLVSKIDVATITTTDMALVVTCLEQTPADNANLEWNCQHWVSDALKRLEARGWLDKTTWEAAFDSMIESLLGGADDQ